MVTNQYANSSIFYENVSFSNPIDLNKFKANIIINLNIRKKITACCFFLYLCKCLAELATAI